MDYAATRANMIDGQVRTNKVIAPGVIAALRAVPREDFVPEALRSVAYVDEDLAVAPGRYLLEPMVVGRLLQAAEVKKTDRALDFATGTGYGAALLTHLAGSVTALDSRSELLDLARRTLATATVPVIFVEAALDAQLLLVPGLAANRFDVVLISGGLPEVPPSLFDLLAEGGRLVAVEKPQRYETEVKPIGTAMLYVKQGREISSRALFDAGTPLLPEFIRKPSFVF